MICPFCLGNHIDLTTCPNTKMPIPETYGKRYGQIPVFFIMFIGYSGHGKTCYLSSLLHSLYEDGYAASWSNFSFRGLTMDTLRNINEVYVTPLQSGHIPLPTTEMMGPLIIHFQNIPLKANPWQRFASALAGNPTAIKQGDAIAVFFDIGGEVYDVKQKIDQSLPVLSKANPLILLIDLPILIEESQGEGPSAQGSLHTLVNNINIALEGIGKAQKDVVISFTKSDRMWGKQDVYGPLAERLDSRIPTIEELPKYLDQLDMYSQQVGHYIEAKYGAFHNVVANNFRNVCYTATSSLGSEPIGDRVQTVSPNRVFDPLFWTLRFSKLL
jgi:GTPase SAR1 family protein